MSKKTFQLILTLTSIFVVLLLVVFVFLLKGILFDTKIPETSLSSNSAIESSEQTNSSQVESSEEPKETVLLDEYKDYYEQNNDMVGWIKVPNTRVNYPVVYREGDVTEFYYLRRNFKRVDDIYGIPFVDGHTKFPTNNILIYGHETDNGTQFHDLNKYKSKDFWSKNKVFTYDTLYEKGEYEIFSVFQDRVYYQHENVFKFYKFYGSENEEEFMNYVKNVKAKSMYDTGITPSFGDELITLVLCDYYITDGRFVLVARKIKK